MIRLVTHTGLFGHRVEALIYAPSNLIGHGWYQPPEKFFILLK